MPERACQGCTRQAEWGCHSKPPIPIIFDDVELDRCPRRPFLDDPVWFDSIYTAHGYLQKGMLPIAGTYLDLPNKLNTAFKVIDSAVHFAEEEDKKKQASMSNTPHHAPAKKHGPPPGFKVAR